MKTPEMQLRIRMRGFRDGAGGRAISIELMSDEYACYEVGYIEGQRASREAATKYAQELGAKNPMVFAATG